MQKKCLVTGYMDFYNLLEFIDGPFGPKITNYTLIL